AGARMTMQLVTLIELEMGFVPAQAGHAYCERFLARPGTTLASAGAKGVDVDPNGKAGAAVAAMGPVGEQAAAPKPFLDQLAIDGAIDQMRGGCHLGTGQPVGKIAAGVFGSGVELQNPGRKILGVAHG